MQVREIMTTNVECISPSTTIEDAAKRMKSMDVGFLPICDKDRLIGTLTDRDIVVRGIAENKDFKINVKNVMTSDVFYCFEDDDVEACAETMKEKEVKRMLVLNRNKRLVGVVSIGDLAKAHETAAAGALKDISQAA
jgi:CBS domain-containing protein